MSGYEKFPLFIAVVVVVLLSINGSVQSNISSLDIARHVKRAATCAIDDYSLYWDGNKYPDTQSPYIQALLGAAGVAQAVFPKPEDWQRDQGLYAWFKAQQLIKAGKLQESLSYLKQSNMSEAVLEAGHPMGWRGDYGCRLFDWLIYEEMVGSTTDNQADWAKSLINEGQAAVVVAGYSRALTYQPDRTDWRLMLARAYLAQGQVTEAKNTLQPLLNGTAEESQAANKLLLEYNNQK